MENEGMKAREPRSVSRRTFAKWGALSAIAASAALTSGCGLSRTRDTSDGNGSALVSDDSHTGGRWVSAQCWADCGSRGFNKVYVKDGVAVRMGTDETVEDTPNCPRVRSCARGRALRAMIFGADRIKYPMKRKNWEPGGGKKELRGKDEWVRISWDEALDLIASELKRIIATYGNEAIVLPGYVTSLFGQWDVGRLLILLGGYMDNWGACSSGAWGSIADYVGLPEDSNDRLDMRNCQLIVLWGSNPAYSRAGLPTWYLHEAKKNGCKFITIDIFHHPTAQALTDEFVGVRPGTDIALALGMAYHLLQEDGKAGKTLLDWDFIKRCTVGFDRETMPAGADPDENFVDYVLGTFDGVPKTPEWAAEICGTPADSIRDIAMQIATTERKAIMMAPSIARHENSDAWPQTIAALGAMTGCIGKSGCWCGSDKGHTWQTGGSPLVNGGMVLGDNAWFTPGGKEMLENPIGGISPSRFTGAPNGMYSKPVAPYVRINNNELWTSVLDGRFTAGKDDIRECKTQMFWHTHSNLMNQAPGTNLAIEAHRKVEFVVTQNMVMTTSAKYSDIVLPVTSQWERIGDMTDGYREQILLSDNVCEPLFEAKDDLWIAEELGKRLGVDMDTLSPTTPQQELLNQLKGAVHINEEGTDYVPLLTITQEDIDAIGAEGEPQEGVIPYTQLREDGIYQIPREEDDNYGHIVLKQFRDDPVANPLTTETGKIEIYSRLLAEDMEKVGFSKGYPSPRYRPASEGYEATFSDWSNKVKGEYPYQFVGYHSPRFAHSTFGNTPILREAFDHALLINPLDAEAEGLVTGDDVLVTSKWGKILRPVQVTPIMMPGVLGLGQGAWVEADEETGIDIAGCVNTLIGPATVAFGHQAFNNCIVKLEKWTKDQLAPDAEWEPRVPVKEA